jgi:hypothetical protein
MGGAMLCRDCEPEIRIEMDKRRSEGKSVNVLHIAKRIYRETHGASSYLLRDIPDGLWQQAKYRAVDDDDSLRDLILKALHSYLD